MLSLHSSTLFNAAVQPMPSLLSSFAPSAMAFQGKAPRKLCIAVGPSPEAQVCASRPAALLFCS